MRLDAGASPRERHAIWEQIRTELTSGWQTQEQPRARRTVGDEREHVLFYVAEILYRIVRESTRNSPTRTPATGRRWLHPSCR